MENNSLGGGGNGNNGSKGMFSGVNPTVLGLELPLPTNNPPNPHQLHHSSMVSSYVPQQPPPFTYPAKPKQLNLSDEEDDGNGGEGKKKISPWQRMKWTDMMVRLLITAVFYIGDEGGATEPAAEQKKKSMGILQKKGKWKSVSRAMMEKGFYVSPQQCEDKFNDLNKRYKRVNDILGKGIACNVVENQSILDSMELTPKIKEEVRKLLNSKHLFFREMCAYHNTCRHGSTTSVAATAVESLSHLPPPQHQHQQQQQQCFHATESAVVAADDESDEDDESEEEDDDDDDHDDEEETESRKKVRRGGNTAAIERLSAEAIGVLQDGGRNAWEKKQWMKNRLIQLEEQQVSYQSQNLELEKQRLKWMKFRSKKEREMERAKLENEKKRLENERMMLMVKQKEMDLMEILHFQKQQQQQNSSNTG